MRICIVAATEMEVSLLRNLLQPSSVNIRFVIHEVGMMQTMYHLMHAIQTERPDLLIQCGVAGTYRDTLTPGDVVWVQEERLGDLGAEDAAGLLDIYDLGLEDKNQFPFKEGRLINPQTVLPELQAVKAITVNLVAGQAQTIALRRAKFDPDIESMEGAALHYVALREQIPFMQIRGISNYVGPRNREAWKLKEAAEAAQDATYKYLMKWKQLYAV